MLVELQTGCFGGKKNGAEMCAVDVEEKVAEASRCPSIGEDGSLRHSFLDLLNVGIHFAVIFFMEAG